MQVYNMAAWLQGIVEARYGLCFVGVANKVSESSIKLMNDLLCLLIEVYPILFMYRYFAQMSYAVKRVLCQLPNVYIYDYIFPSVNSTSLQMATYTIPICREMWKENEKAIG